MFEMMIAMNVVDAEEYRAYRNAMTPLLAQQGGKFRYDFSIAETYSSEAGHTINRVFALSFPDRQARDQFFANPDYLRVRQAHFSKAVAARTLIAEYDLASSTE